VAIWQTVDRDGRTVTLTEADWAHILDEHREMVGRDPDIHRTVERPNFVTRDATHAHGENSYLRVAPGPLYLKVVVRYRPVPPQGTWAGRIITAYPTKQVKGEQHLWP